MAVVFTETMDTVMGDKRMIAGTIDLTGVTSGAVAIGLRKIDCIATSPQSVTTTLSPMFTVNTGSGATAINGQLAVSNGTSGDLFYVVCYGD